MKSNCCKGEMKVVGGDEGTMFWQCLECGKGCDMHFKARGVYQDATCTEHGRKGFFHKLIEVVLPPEENG